MYCTKCGNKIDDNANFCPSCGEKITRENNNTPQQDMPSKDKNINQEKVDLNKKSIIKENNEEKIDLSKYKFNINNDKVEENKGQDEFKSEASSCIYGNKEFKISAQKHTEGTEYETTITFNETDITIKKETKKKFKKYNKEYKFNIDDVLYVTNTKHLSTFMMIFTVCATLACIYAFGIKALFILIIDIIFSIYRCIEIGFKNGDKINIVLDGIFGKRDCTEIIEHMNRISGERISNDKKHSQNVIIKNILSILAATGFVLGFGIYTALTEPGSNIKIDNKYKEENTKKLYEEINNIQTSSKKEDTLATKEEDSKKETSKQEETKQEQVKEEETKKPEEKIQEEPVEEKELSAEEAKNLIEQADSNYLNKWQLFTKIINGGEGEATSILKNVGINLNNETAYFFSMLENKNPDNEDGFYIVTSKSKKVYRVSHQGGLPIYEVSNNTIMEKYNPKELEKVAEKIEGYWISTDEEYHMNINNIYFNGMLYAILSGDETEAKILITDEDTSYTLNLVFEDYNHVDVYIYDYNLGYTEQGKFTRQ